MSKVQINLYIDDLTVIMFLHRHSHIIKLFCAFLRSQVRIVSNVLLNMSCTIKIYSRSETLLLYNFTILAPLRLFVINIPTCIMDKRIQKRYVLKTPNSKTEMES